MTFCDDLNIQQLGLKLTQILNALKIHYLHQFQMCEKFIDKKLGACATAGRIKPGTCMCSAT